MLKHLDVLHYGFRGIPKIQGGIEKHAEELLPRISRAGYSVTAVCRRPYVESGSFGKVKINTVLTLKIKGLETLLYSFMCAFITLYTRPRIVHVHAIGSCVSLPIVKFSGAKIVFTHHGIEYQSKKWGWIGKIILRIGEHSAALFSDEIICVSNHLQRHMLNKYNRQSHVIPNGVNLNNYADYANFQVPLPLQKKKYILIVSRLVPEKRHRDLIQAFISLNLINYKLVIVGAAAHGDTYSEALISEYSNISSIFFAGFKSGEELVALYAQAALFVLPSELEGNPICLLEAMSYCVPIIASDIEANIELNLNPECYYTMGNITELSKKILLSLAADNGEQTRRHKALLTSYSWDKIAQRTIELCYEPE